MHSDSAHHSSIIILGSDSLQQETSHGDGGAGQQVGEAVGERERLQQAKDSCRHGRFLVPVASRAGSSDTDTSEGGAGADDTVSVLTKGGEEGAAKQ